MFPFPGENTDQTTTDAETVSAVAAAVVENETGAAVTPAQQSAELNAVRKAELEAALASLGYQLVPITPPAIQAPAVSPVAAPVQPQEPPATSAAPGSSAETTTDPAPVTPAPVSAGGDVPAVSTGA